MDRVKKALIVGGSSDIGSELVEIYLQNGFKVLSTGRNSNYVHKNAICASGIDLTSEEGVGRLQSLARELSPSCVAYLPGYIDNLTLDELSVDSLTKAFTCNTFAYWLLINACKERMGKRKFGRFCILSSIGSKFGGGKNRFSYSSSKMVLEFFPREIRDLGSLNIFANNIICGVTDTKMLDRREEGKAERASLIPAKRIASPLEIAIEIYALGSDKNTFRHCSNTTISGGE